MLYKQMRDCVLLLASVTVGPGIASAQTQPALTVPSHLTVMGFTLGKTKLVDVEAKLGKSVVRKRSHEEEASEQICYTSAGDHTKVIFEAGFSGGWNELDGYKVIAPGFARRYYSQCARTDLISRDVQTEGGLKLGMTREQLISLLGAPRQAQGNKLIFEWLSRQAMTKEQIERASKTFKSPVSDPYYDVLDTIEITLADLKVVEFEVHHIVTY